MFHNLVPKIIGSYNPGAGTVSIDMSSLLFQESPDTEFHETTHYYLSKFTNYGIVYTLLSEILFYKDKRGMSIPEKNVREIIGLLHKNMYNAQEGFAHIMQARTYYKDGGIEAVREFEHKLPQAPRIALSHCVDFVKFEQDYFDKFTENISLLTFNTNLHTDVVENPTLLFDVDKLKSYLEDETNNPDKRFQKLCRAIEAEKDVLLKDKAQICLETGIVFNNMKTNKEMATLINYINSAFTSRPTFLTKEDINVVTDKDIFKPVYDGLIMMDTNMQSEAKIGLSKEDIIREASRFRAIYIYNCRDEQKELIPFYSYSENRNIINVVIDKNEENIKTIFKNKPTTIIDSLTIDYSKNCLFAERKYLRPNIVWYKHYLDMEILLTMINALNLKAKLGVIRFSEDSKFIMYIIKIIDENHLHLLAALPYTCRKILDKTKSLEIIRNKEDLKELVMENERHINNFCHDILGMHPFLNITAMLENAEKHLEFALQVKEKGMGRNDRCICGSEIKYKHCHGS